MNHTTMSSTAALNASSNASSGLSRTESWIRRMARQAVMVRLRRLRRGSVTVIEGSEQQTFGRETADCRHRATVTVHDARTYVDIAMGGTIGVGNAYRRGFWSCDDLTMLVRIFVLNRELLDGMDGGLARITMTPLLKVLHGLRRNTIAGSRKNIAAHYDLGNDFFRLMLDETMMYSCAYFDRPDATLAEASRAKNDRICRKLRLRPDDHVLEIGTGWGGFAIHAATQYGCRVTTTTISQQQFDFAAARIRAAGLSERITVIQQDYRDLPGLDCQFDKLVSIEMIEAVGRHYFNDFFKVCGKMLKPRGLMLLQGITMDERIYERAKHSVDFIQHYIFPGCCIPSVSVLSRASAQASDLGLVALEDIGQHYPSTLRAWRQNIAERLPEIKALGYQPEFLRLWDLYLSYCEGGFLERSISNVQMLFCKPDWRPEPTGC